MAKRKSEVRRFGRDVGVIVIAGIVSGALALALYSRRKRAADSANDLPSSEELRQRLIATGPVDSYSPGTPGEALVDDMLTEQMEGF